MTVLERKSGVALWRQIERIIESDISSKVYSPNNRLPTEKELAIRFGVNRHTLRRAMASLEERGIIRIKQGHGTFVSEDVLDYRIGKRTRFSENVSQQDKRAVGTLLQSRHELADEEISAALQVPLTTNCLVIETMRLVDARPISVSSHYLDAKRFEGLETMFERYNSFTQALSHYGINDYLRRETIVTARMPNASDALQLRQPRTRPILNSESIDVDLDGKPFQFNRTRFAADRVQFLIA